MWKNSRKETEMIKSCMINQILKKIIGQLCKNHHTADSHLYIFLNVQVEAERLLGKLYIL